MPKHLQKLSNYDVADMLSHPSFGQAVSLSNRRMMIIYRYLPQYALQTMDMRQSIMSHGAMYLNYSHRLNPMMPALAAGQLFKTVKENKVISYNIVSGFLKSMEKSGYLEPSCSPDGRSRAFKFSKLSDRLSCLYLMLNLQSLDILDGGRRRQIARDMPSLLITMLPIYAESILKNIATQQLPESIGNITTTGIGTMMLNEIMGARPLQEQDDQTRIPIRLSSPSILSARFATKRTNIMRIIDMMRASGDFGESPDGQWVSARIFKDNDRWQATKMVEVSKAFTAAYKISVPSAAHLL